LHGEAIDVGRSTGTPLLDATVRVAPVAPCDGQPLWTQHGEVTTVNETLTIDRELRRRDSGAFVLSSTRGPSLEVDGDAATITVDDGDLAAQRQLVASFGLSLALHTSEALLLHGAAATLGDRTVMVCGDSGAGKSSLLVAMIDAGWTPITEDLGAIDIRDGASAIWPGPPWVRLARGQAGPAGSAVAFDGVDKTAWSITTTETRRNITHVVIVQPPGGDAPTIETMATAEVIAALLPSTVWLGDPSERSARVFGRLAAFHRRVTTTRLRMPRRATWAEEAVALLGAL
jgi:hypothetical protein